MPNLIAIPDSLQLLRQGLIEGASVEDLALPLRALQQRGLSQPDLVLKIERIRIENQLTGADEEVEERSLLALDLVHGVGGDQALQWDVQPRLRCFYLGRSHPRISQAQSDTRSNHQTCCPPAGGTSASPACSTR